MMFFVFDRVESIVGKRENTGNQHFLIFPEFLYGLIGCLVFNALISVIIVISWRPVHIYMYMLIWSSFYQYSVQYSFPSHWLLFRFIIVEAMDWVGKGMNPPLTITTLYYQSSGRILAVPGIGPATHFSQVHEICVRKATMHIKTGQGFSCG